MTYRIRPQSKQRLAAKSLPPSKSSSAISPVMKAIKNSPSINVVGPVKFNLSSLKNCQDLCLLVVTDKRGLKMYVRFFKEEFYSQLSKKSSNVTLKGNTRVETGRLYMFLQSVR